MYVVCVSIQVKPENVDRFIQATLDNHLGTRREEGNARFDLIQSEEDVTRFMLYEVYRDKSAFEAHQKTEHYLRWRDTVKDWMAVPRQGVRYRGVFPEDEASW